MTSFNPVSLVSFAAQTILGTRKAKAEGTVAVLEDFNDPVKCNADVANPKYRFYFWRSTLSFQDGAMILTATDDLSTVNGIPQGGPYVMMKVNPTATEAGKNYAVRLRIKGEIDSTDFPYDKAVSVLIERPLGQFCCTYYNIDLANISRDNYSDVVIPVENSSYINRVDILLPVVVGRSGYLKIDDVSIIELPSTPTTPTTPITPNPITPNVLYTKVDKVLTIPNPFNPRSSGVTFKFNVPDKATKAAISVYNQAGRLIHRTEDIAVASAALAKRDAMVSWDGKSNGVPVARGTYFYQITFDNGKPIRGALSVTN
jgi:hypothetical protein